MRRKGQQIIAARGGFVLLELVLVVAILYLLTPPGRSSLAALRADELRPYLIGGLVAALVAAIFWFRFASVLGFRLLGANHREAALESRRRMIRLPGRKTRAEREIDAMDDAQVASAAEARSRDPLVVEARCERLKEGGDWSAYAAEREYFLTLESGLAIEERCRLYNELADLYLGALDRPDRARAALRALVEAFPRSYQATLARERLRRMAPDEESP